MSGNETLREDVLAEIAHDLRTPLAAIAGYAELLRTRRDEAIQREAPVAIEDAARRLLAVVDAALARAAAKEEER